MKNKKFEKKLHLNKRTITNLGKSDQEWVKGGDPLTVDPTICQTCTCPYTYTCTCPCVNTCICTNETCPPECIY